MYQPQHSIHPESNQGPCDLSALKVTCANCNLRELCVPGGIPVSKLEQLDSLVAKRRRVKRGDSLFAIGARFSSLYALRTGFFKTCASIGGMRCQITGFQIPGELLGLDGLASESHTVEAVALEDSELCILPFSQLERIARDFQPLQHQLHRVMSREIVREHSVMMLLGSMRSDQRVAAFLLNLSERYKCLGYAADEFVLRMTREEIGSYLGLKLETVSRSLSRFQSLRIIEINGRNVKLVDFPKLRDILAGPE